MIENRLTVDINSANRVNGSNESFDYNIQLDNTIKYTHVVVIQANIPKTYYLVAAPYNQFQVQEGSNIFTITVPEGNYNPTSFIKTVIPLMNNVCAFRYAATFGMSNSGPSTAKFTYTVTGNGSVQPSFIMMPNMTVYDQFGFSDASTNTFTTSNNLVSSSVVSYDLEDNLQIRSNVMVSDGKIGILQAIYPGMSVDWSNIVWNCADHQAFAKKFARDSNATGGSGTFHFSLCNEDGKQINLNGKNWCFRLLFFVESDIFKVVNNFLTEFRGKNKSY